MRWLEVNPEGVVINIIVWDGVTPYTPAGVAQLLPCDDNPGVSYGWKIVDGMWEVPLPVEVPPVEEPEI
jgi:hypothetical protein